MRKTVHISFDRSLLADIDEQAQSEGRSRSEWVREAVRSGVARKRRWNQVIALGKAITQQRGLTEKDVEREIQAHRRARRR